MLKWALSAVSHCDMMRQMQSMAKRRVAAPIAVKVPPQSEWAVLKADESSSLQESESTSTSAAAGRSAVASQ